MPRITKLPTPKKLSTKHKRPKPAASEQIKAHTGSNITNSEYSPETGHLIVTFTSGARYRYESVTRAQESAYRAADSQGSFLHQHIIGRHKAVKL